MKSTGAPDQRPGIDPCQDPAEQPELPERPELPALLERPDPGGQGASIDVVPVVVVTRTFPARPSSIPEIRAFVRECLAHSPLTAEENRAVDQAVARALLDAAGEEGAVQITFRVFPDHAEVDILKAPPTPRAAPLAAEPDQADRPATFAGWMADVLVREGLSHEAVARRLGVSVKTIGRWVGGTTEPRLRDLRRIREEFGPTPFS
jgi:Helix-turn-helix domain